MIVTEAFTGCVSQLKEGAAHTLAPERYTLLLMSLTDAVVTVTIHVLTGVAVVQVDVCGAVRTAAGAELGQVAGVAGLAAGCAC